MTPIPKNEIKSQVNRGVHRGLLIGLALGLSLSLILFETVPERLFPVSEWEKALKEIGKHTCENNKGLRDITLEEQKDTYSFNCKDGLSLKDTVVRLK